jgi:ribose 5-phosphate isomerase B
MKRKLITEEDVRKAHRSGKPLYITQSILLTPSAKDAIKELNVRVEIQDVIPGVTAEKKKYGIPRLANLKVVALASDHGGFAMKEFLKNFISGLEYEVRDYGCESEESVDYPDYAAKVAQAVSNGDAWRGIIVDAAGIGSCIVANKFKGVRAALVYDVMTATNCREHNNANIITLGGKLIGSSVAQKIVEIFLETSFAGNRHEQRINKIKSIEDKNFK